MQPPWLQPRTAYIHVPFCAHHCGYCDFAVTVGQDHLMGLYVEALEVELRQLGRPTPVETLFVGGGTPTYLSLAQLERLLTLVHHWLPVPTDAEVSIEATPDSFNAEKANLLAELGVNRVSLGVQSFQPALLKALDRRHSAQDIPQAVEAARSAGLTVSLDLIFAVPGSSLDLWRADLDAALTLQPNHISTYGLTYEKGTPLWKAWQRDQVSALPEEVELAMYQEAMERLEAAGYEQYEISNFAQVGYRCRHNERYWANEAYYGFGVGAARYVLGTRELNVRNTLLYIRRVLSGESPTFQRETLPPWERAFETIALQLRRREGIERARFQEQTGYALDALIGPDVEMFVNLGLLADEGGRVRLTRQGRCVADGIVSRLLKPPAGMTTPPKSESHKISPAGCEHGQLLER